MNPKKTIGTVNGAILATLWRGNVIVGHCIDTPNSIAYGMLKTGADRSTSWLGTKLRSDMDAAHVASGGGQWMRSDADAMFTAA